MKIFPTTELKFNLIDNQDETLDRLKRRTEHSENLTSQYTDKSFRGKIDGTNFKIISSTIGKGAFCVMTGEISTDQGKVKAEIHKVFRILLSIILVFPIIGLLIMIFSGTDDFSPIMILVTIGQILIIRYAFIGLAFRFLSKASLNRLRDVLDIEWKKTRHNRVDCPASND
ncbi:MAG: hypothetical protein ACOCQ4_03585 [bacterium]